MDARLNTAIKLLATIILATIVIMGIIGFIERVRTVAIIVVGAVFLVYIIYPAVRRLNAKLPLWLSVLIVYAVIIVLVGLALAFMLPALVSNVQQVVHDAPHLARQIQTLVASPHSKLMSRVPPPVRDYLLRLPSQIAALLQRYGSEAATRAFTVLVSLVTIAALFIAIPVVAIYILIDLDGMRRAVLSAVPAPLRPRVVKIAMECNAAVGGFVRGQLLVAAIVGVLVILLLEGLHVKYAILIGVFAGIIEIIPYVGALVGGFIAVVTALFTNGWENAVIVLVGFVVINQLEGHVIYPFVVSGSVGLSPLLVILALLAGGELFGLPGLIIAIPLAALIKVVIENAIPVQEPLEIEPSLRRAKRLAASSAVAKMIANARSRGKKPETRS